MPKGLLVIRVFKESLGLKDQWEWMVSRVNEVPKGILVMLDQRVPLENQASLEGRVKEVILVPMVILDHRGVLENLDPWVQKAIWVWKVRKDFLDPREVVQLLEKEEK